MVGSAFQWRSPFGRDRDSLAIISLSLSLYPPPSSLGSHPCLHTDLRRGKLNAALCDSKMNFSWGLLLLLGASLLIYTSLPMATAFNAVCEEGKKCVSNKTCAQIFSPEDFETLFPQRNQPIAHATGFWDYHSFITAAKMFEPLGFCTTGGDLMQKTELAAFFANVAHETTCGWSMALKGAFAWGLCYKEELSPDSLYCEKSFLYPCAPGVSYHGRGALPLYYNYNYGQAGKYLKLDLLHRPDFVSSNATIAFQTAIWRWMTPMKEKQPSCHEVMVGKWTPTKNDTFNLRYPGFGMTINILDGFVECGHGDDIRMVDRISHYLTFLNYLGVGQDNAGPYTGCGLQKVLNTPLDKS